MSTLRVTNIQDLAGNDVFSLSGGNMTVAGNLTVQGTTTSIETTNLTIEDKNIVLGLTDPAATDVTADGGGITLKGDTDKTIAWNNTSGSWHSNVGVNITSGNLGIGTISPLDPLHVLGPDGSSGNPSLSSNNIALFQNDGAAGDGAVISVVAGNAATAQISLGDVDNANIGAVMYDNATNALSFATNGSANRVVIDSSGRVGIGTTNPVSTVDCKGQLSISNNATSYWLFDRDDSDGRLKLLDSSTSANERLAVDSSGRLLVGTSSSSDNISLALAGNSGGSTGDSKLLLVYEGTAPDNGNTLSSISFGDNSHQSSSSKYAAEIKAQRDGGTWTSGTSMPGRLVFSTTADGTSSPTERLRIDSSGNVDIGSAISGGYVSGALIQSGGKIASYVSNSTAGSDQRIYVYNGSTSTYTASINADGSATFAGQVLAVLSNSNSVCFKAEHTGANAEAIQIGNGSATTIRIKADGSATFAGTVGINTTNPQTLLNVKASSNTTDDYSLTLANLNENYGMQFGAYGASNKSYGASSIDYKIEIGGDLILDTTGNVGIGTDSPQAKLSVTSGTNLAYPTQVNAQLHINSSAGAAGMLIASDTLSNIFFADGASSAVGRIYYDHTSNFIAVHTNSIERLRITSTGQLSHIGGGTSGSPAVGFDGSAPSNSLVVNSTGNVGIGTSSPESKVTIAPANSSSSSFAGRSIAYGTNLIAVSGRSGFLVRNSNNFVQDNDNSAFQYLYPFDDGITGPYKVFRTANGSTLVDKFWVDINGGSYFAGNVGIGTTNPSVLLHLHSGANTTLRLSDSAGGYTDAIYNESGTLSQFIIDADPANTSTPATEILFKIDGSEKLRIKSSGDVGIGTDTPSSRLAVNGSITESTDGGTTYHNVVTAQDIGTAPNEVPLNQFLGQLAFMDEVGDIPTSSSAPQENLSVNFEYVSDTSIKIRMRGSDGVVRSATLTLS